MYCYFKFFLKTICYERLFLNVIVRPLSYPKNTIPLQRLKNANSTIVNLGIA